MIPILKKVALCTLCLASVKSDAQPDYYTIVSFPIGQILAEPTNSVSLPDGSTITVKRIGLGNSRNNLNADFGAFNTNILGGNFNGIVNINDNSGNASSQGITLSSYSGNRVAGSFTRISANTGNVDRNGTNNPYLYRNGIGFYIHTSTPQKYANFLMIDCGGDAGTSDNREWLSSFGYLRQSNNTYTLVQPGYALSSNTYLSQYNNESVHTTWETTVQTALNEPGITMSSANIVRKTSGPGLLDPDDTSVQAAISYGNNLLTDVFFFWGIWGNATNGNMQSSGLSPLVFGYNFDFGDAPATYNTLLADSGARHLWTDNSQIYLGTTVNREADGDALTANATAHNDDNGRLDGNLSFSIHTDSLKKSYARFTYPVAYVNNTGKDGHIAAWVDWNGDGRFSSDEGITGTTPAGSTQDTFLLTWTNKILQRKNLSADKTFIRVRYSTDPITTGDFLGPKSDGEVEDYAIQIANSLLPDKPLDVDLLSFDVKESKNDLVCSWSVANQSHIDSYKILRSTNGKLFETMADITANDLREYDYTFTLQSANRVPAFYRLGIYDRNGKISYSNTRFLNGRTDGLMSIYPNPAKSQVHIILNAETERPGNLYDATGRLVRAVNLQPGTNTIDVRTWMNGVYFLVLKGEQALPSYSTFKVSN